MLNVSNAGFMGEIWKRTRNESDIGDKGPVQLVFVEDIAVFVGGEVASVVPRLPEQAGQQWRKRTGAEEGKDSRAGTGWTAVAGKKLERGKGRAELVQAGQQWRERTGAEEGKGRAGTGWTAVAGKNWSGGREGQSWYRLDSCGGKELERRKGRAELVQAGQQRAGLAGRRHAAVLQSSSELRSTNFSLQINSTTRKLTAVDRVSRSDRPTDRVRTLASAGLDSATQHASPRQPAADDATVETYYYGH